MSNISPVDNSNLTPPGGVGYHNVMCAKKYKKQDHEIIPISSSKRIERWHVCQQIGVVYYESQVSVEQLLQILDFLRRRGIITE